MAHEIMIMPNDIVDSTKSSVDCCFSSTLAARVASGRKLSEVRITENKMNTLTL